MRRARGDRERRQSAAIGAVVPLTDEGLALGDLRREGDAASERLVNADWNVISPEYLSMLHISVTRGRDFTAADRTGARLRSAS